MTEQEIRDMVHRACDPSMADPWHNEFWTITQQEMARVIAAARASEREACARICDDLIGSRAMARHCADAIRARGSNE